MKTMKALLSSLFVCTFCFLLYVCSSFWFLRAGFSSVESAMCAGIISTLFCAVFYFRDKTRAVLPSPGFGVPYLLLFLVFGVVVWYCSQAASQLVYYFMQDDAYKTYQNLISYDERLYVVLTLFIAPIAEEMLMRGTIFRELSKWSVVLAYVVSIGLFTFMHGTLVHVPLAVLCGFLFCLVYDYSGKIRYSIILHSIFNAMSLVLSVPVRHDIFYTAFVVFMYFICLVMLVKFAVYRHMLISNKVAVYRGIPTDAHSDTPVVSDSVKSDELN